MIRVRLAFYTLTLTGISTLIGAFANPLQKLEVWSQLRHAEKRQGVKGGT